MTTEITTIDALEKGDKVAVTGNGFDVDREVVDIYQDSWKGKKTARLAGTDHAYQLTDNMGGPLMAEGVQCNGMAVTVEREA